VAPVSDPGAEGRGRPLLPGRIFGSARISRRLSRLWWVSA